MFIWAKALVSLKTLNMMLHQRHFYWLFSRLSMRPSYQMDVIELKTSLLPICDGLQLKRWRYFEIDLTGGSAIKYYCVVNDEQKLLGIKIGGEYLSVTNK